MAANITEKHPGLSFNLPNTHLLIELLVRAMPILKNAHFSRTGTFESHHRQMKEAMKHFQSQGAINFEKTSLQQVCLLDTLLFIYEGGRWGEELQHCAGSSLLELKDYGKGREDLPHPILRHVCRYSALKDQEARSNYRSNWRSNGMVYIKQGSYKIKDKTMPAAAEVKDIQAGLDQYYAEYKVQIDDTTQFKWVSGLVNTSSSPRVSIRCGEDIEIDFDGGVQYVQVQKCLLIHHQQYIYPFFFPLWYEKRNNSLMQIVSKWNGNQDTLIPLPPTVYAQHVLVLHNCNRNCECQLPECTCENICKIRRLCKIHRDFHCPVCSKQSFIKADMHSSKNEFMVFNSSFGFVLDL